MEGSYSTPQFQESEFRLMCFVGRQLSDLNIRIKFGSPLSVRIQKPSFKGERILQILIHCTLRFVD